MGTNFYTKLNYCDKCHRGDEIHLGKSSMGWQFSFQYNGGEYYKNVEEMKEWLKDKTIIDECGDIIEYKQFWEMVAVKQEKFTNSHAEQFGDKVIDGYSFTDSEFS